MNFDFTDDQRAIKSTAHEFVAARFRPDKVRELAESGTYDPGSWNEMAELGWPGIFVDEDHGGQGLGVLELVILTEELGYVGAPSPFLSNAAAGLLLSHAGSDEQKARWLPGVASGEARGTVGGGGKDGAAPARPAGRAGWWGRTGPRRSCPTRSRPSSSCWSTARPRPWCRRATRPSSASTRSTTPGPTRACRCPGETHCRATCAAGSTASRWRWPARWSGSRRSRWRWPSSTRRTASSSGGRSAPTRPS